MKIKITIRRLLHNQRVLRINLLKSINKIDKVTDQTTKMLKGADKAMTALEAPKVKYTKNVYHLGKGEIEGDKFDLMGESDFGIHVGTKGQADTVNKMKYGVADVTNKPTLELEGKDIKAVGQRTFPLKIANDLKPARIPDVGLFYSPQNWLNNLTVASDDNEVVQFTFVVVFVNEIGFLLVPPI